MPPTPYVPVAATHPPHDRVIYIRANVVHACPDCHTSVIPFEGRAHWSESAQDWHNAAGMSIRQNFAAELVIIDWREWHAADADNDPGYAPDESGDDYGIDESFVEPGDLDQSSANPFPALRTVADEQQARLTALESEHEALLANLRDRPVAEFSAGLHDKKVCRLGEVGAQIRALAQVCPAAIHP